MTTIKYGFTGTRDGLNTAQRKSITNLLQKHIDLDDIIEVHHGDCIGADKDFHDICTSLNKQGIFDIKQNTPDVKQIKIIIHPPNIDTLRAFCKSDNITKPRDYLERNKDIINSTNVLIACPLNDMEIARSGTWMTVRYARRQNKKILLFV